MIAIDSRVYDALNGRNRSKRFSDSNWITIGESELSVNCYNCLWECAGQCVLHSSSWSITHYFEVKKLIKHHSLFRVYINLNKEQQDKASDITYQSVPLTFCS